jgi:adenylate kinase family enzyme
LLTDGQFRIARHILCGFLQTEQVRSEDILILNGLPRHSGQARAIEPLLNIFMIVHLRCPASIARERIRLNSGGDRADRVDDLHEEVENRLRIFEKETIPLLDYYRSRGAAAIDVEVGVGTGPEDVAARLPQEDAWPPTGKAREQWAPCE